MNIMHIERRSVPKFMEAPEFLGALENMKKDSSLNTERGFVKRHMTYLLAHPKVNPANYLANLRAMIRNRA